MRRLPGTCPRGHTYSTSSSGRLYCRECQYAAKVRYRDKCNANMRKRAAERRRWLGDLKVTSGCMDCGFSRWPEALDFDHRPGEVKSFSLSDCRARSEAAVLAEVAKCDIVCANCHRHRTQERKQYV